MGQITMNFIQLIGSYLKLLYQISIFSLKVLFELKISCECDFILSCIIVVEVLAALT